MKNKIVGYVYNPVTKKYYEIKEKTEKTDLKKQIKGLWKR